MEIIATTEDGYLVKMNDDELAACQALVSVDKRYKKPKIGDKLQFSQIWEAVAYILSPQKIAEFRRLSKELEDFATAQEQLQSANLPAISHLKYQSSH